MIVHNAPEFTHYLVSMADGNHHLFWSTGKSLVNGTMVLAQTYDIFTDMQKAWSNFWSTGQAAAFVIGIMFGWFIKGILP